MVTIPQIFRAFFKVGALTLGGGMAMLGVLRHEIITKRRWMTEEDFTRDLAMATSLPGAMAVNFSLFCGYRMRGTAGAAAAFLGTVAPSFVAILIVAAFLFPYFAHPAAAFLRGAAAAVAGLLAYTAFKMCKPMVTKAKHAIAALIAAIIALMPNVNPVFALIIVSAAMFAMMSRKKTPGVNDGTDRGENRHISAEDRQ